METIIYTVRKGDTLYDIARRFNTTVGIISRYNGIIDPDRIEAGRILRIPVSEIPHSRPEKCVPFREYIVKKGDTLKDIALKHNISIQKLAAFNRLSDPSQIKEDQVLRIPLETGICRQREYIVREGDTLDSIAEKYGLSADTLASLNRLNDKDLIFAGQGIVLFEDKTDDEFEPDTTDEPIITPSDDADNSEESISYVVQSGDTLYQIAKRYGVSTAYLINLNQLTQPDRIFPGQVIIIRK